MRIGIIIPAYNVAPWIGDAIRSVLTQSYPDWTMVVVDDGSTDATAEIAAGFHDARIRLIRQPNAGVSAARNRGIAALDTDVLLFLDADDWLAPDALARLADTLGASPDAVAAAGAFAFVSPHGRTSRPRQPPSGDVLQRLLLRNRFANGGHLLLRRAAMHRAGLFRPDLTYGEDWEYWIRLALLGRLAAVRGRSPVLFVRRRTGSAYHRLAVDPAALTPCLQAIFANTDLQRRISPSRMAALRRRAEAENAWVVGRELIRHGRDREGTAWLRRSFLAHPSVKRAVMVAAAHALPLLPGSLRVP